MGWVVIIFGWVTSSCWQKKSPPPNPPKPVPPRRPPRVPGAQGGSLDGRGWVYAPGADWGAHFCQLTALTGPRGVLCVHPGAVWRLFWANFAVVGAMKFPFCVVSARYGPGMRYRVYQAGRRFLVGAAPIFLLCRPSIQGVSHFFAASRGVLCGFTWLFPGATFMCFYVGHPIHCWSQLPV